MATLNRDRATGRVQGFGQQTHKSKGLGASDGAANDESGDASEPAPAAKAAAPAAKAAEPAPVRASAAATTTTTTTAAAAAAPAPRATKTDDVSAVARRASRPSPKALTAMATLRGKCAGAAGGSCARREHRGRCPRVQAQAAVCAQVCHGRPGVVVEQDRRAR